MTPPSKPYLPATSDTPQLQNTAVLIYAVENVFRKLIRMLIGKMSLKKLQEMIQVIFIEEAEEKLQREAPGKNVPLSTLAVVTGFDTRTLTRIKGEETYLKPLHEVKRFLSEITPECSVLDVWESSSKYRDIGSGEPGVLPIRGSEVSFESLIKDSSSTRGVSLTTFLKRLEASKSIVIDKANDSVRMIDKRYTPLEAEGQTENIKIGLAAVANLIDTITHNLNAPSLGEESFYQKGCWTNRLDRNDCDKLRKLVKNFLLRSDEKVRKIMQPFEREVANNDQVTAGISMYYFEEIPQS